MDLQAWRSILFLDEVCFDWLADNYGEISCQIIAALQAHRLLTLGPRSLNQDLARLSSMATLS